MKSSICIDHCPWTLRLPPHFVFCEWCYEVECTNPSSSPCLVCLDMLLQSGTAWPHGECMFSFGAGTATLFSILTVCYTGLPSLQQFTRLLFLHSSQQAMVCSANQGHTDGSIFLYTLSLRWLVVLSTLHLLTRPLNTLWKSVYLCKQVLCPLLTKILEIFVVVVGLIVDATLSKLFFKFQN